MDLKKIKMELSKIFASLNMATDKIWNESELKISDKGVGGSVELINADSTLSPVEDGDYVMEDGTKFQVKAGLITNWNGETEKPATDDTAMTDTPADEAAETPADEVAEEDETDKIIAEMQTAIDEQAKEIEALKTSIEEIKSNFSSKEDVANFSKQLEGLNSTLKTIAGIPAEFSKTSNSITIKDSQEDKRNDLARVFAELKK